MIDKINFEIKKNNFEKGKIFADSFNDEEAEELIKIYKEELERNKKDLEYTENAINNLKNKIGN